MYEPGGTKEADVIRFVLLDSDSTIHERVEKLKELISEGNITETCENYLKKSIQTMESEGLSGQAEAYLYAASRAETNQKVIIPSMEKGELVLSRRSVACSMSLGMDNIWEINQKALNGAYPTLEIYLDVPAEVAQERLKGRTEKQDRLDNEKFDFHQKTVIGYRTYFEKYCPYPYILVDGTKSKEDLLEEVKKIVKEHLKTAE
jgi:dTMP kinase